MESLFYLITCYFSVFYTIEILYITQISFNFVSKLKFVNRYHNLLWIIYLIFDKVLKRKMI